MKNQKKLNKKDVNLVTEKLHALDLTLNPIEIPKTAEIVTMKTGKNSYPFARPTTKSDFSIVAHVKVKDDFYIRFEGNSLTDIINTYGDNKFIIDMI